MVARLKLFFAEARQEFRHVNWPGRSEALRLTAVVIGGSLAVALFLGLADFVFSYLLRSIIL